jgi:hypothetical protein
MVTAVRCKAQNTKHTAKITSLLKINKLHSEHVAQSPARSGGGAVDVVFIAPTNGTRCRRSTMMSPSVVLSNSDTLISLIF